MLHFLGLPALMSVRLPFSVHAELGQDGARRNSQLLPRPSAPTRVRGGDAGSTPGSSGARTAGPPPTLPTRAEVCTRQNLQAQPCQGSPDRCPPASFEKKLWVPASGTLEDTEAQATPAGLGPPAAPAHPSPPLLKRTFFPASLPLPWSQAPWALTPFSLMELHQQASTAKSNGRARSHMTQQQDLEAITLAFLKFCSLTSEVHLLASSILG